VQEEAANLWLELDNYCTSSYEILSGVLSHIKQATQMLRAGQAGPSPFPMCLPEAVKREPHNKQIMQQRRLKRVVGKPGRKKSTKAIKTHQEKRNEELALKNETTAERSNGPAYDHEY